MTEGTDAMISEEMVEMARTLARAVAIPAENMSLYERNVSLLTDALMSVRRAALSAAGVGKLVEAAQALLEDPAIRFSLKADELRSALSSFTGTRT